MAFERDVQFDRYLTDVDSSDARIVRVDDPQGNDAGNSGGNSASQAEQLAARQNQQLQRLEQMLADVQETLQEVESRRGASLDELQRLAIDLACHVSQAVLHGAMQADPQLLQKLVGSAVERLGGGRPLRIHVHPDQLKQLADLNSELLHDDTQWQPDPNLQLNSFQVENNDEGLLFELDSRVDDIRQTLLEELGNAQTERRTTTDGNQTVRRFPERRETA